MNIWLFGKSSDFSQHMVDQWHEDGHKVTQLGRENVNYTNPAEFIEQAKDNLPFPDYVVFNINVGVPFELNHPIHNQNVDTQKIILKERLHILLVKLQKTQILSLKIYLHIKCNEH